jgi:hypothetical protein
MPKRKKQKPIEEKHPIELTDDEAMEHLFGKEVKDKLKEFVREADKKAKKSSHK